MADAVGRGIAREVGLGAARFLARQRFVVASSSDVTGRVWASVLTGPPGFASALDPELVHLAVNPPDDDPLSPNLAVASPLGLLAIDLETRQRVRFNGRGVRSDGGIFLDIAQVYGNCPKYIQRRTIVATSDDAPGRAHVARALTAAQRARIEGADTLFIASAHPDAGADASHRGGAPGFVSVESETRLSFPDYPGNAMFNTLGNLSTQPNTGLLFVDFESGDVTRLTGRARVAPDRRVTLDIDEVRETPRGCGLRFRFVDFSPAIPSLANVTIPVTPASE